MNKIEKFKKLFKDDSKILDIINEAYDNGDIDNNGNLSEEVKEATKGFDSYYRYLENKQRMTLKINGDSITLENSSADVLIAAANNVKATRDFAYEKAKAKNPKLKKQFFMDNTKVHLKSASFQVDIEFPVPSEQIPELKEEIDLLVNSINTTQSTARISKETKKLLESFNEILEIKGVEQVKLGSEKNLENISPIKKNRQRYIQQTLSLVEEVEDTSFKDEVVIYATNTLNKKFSGFALRKNKKLTFDCSDAEQKNAWWLAMNNQVNEADNATDFSSEDTKFPYVRVKGDYISKETIKVSSIEILK